MFLLRFLLSLLPSTKKLPTMHLPSLQLPTVLASLLKTLLLCHILTFRSIVDKLWKAQKLEDLTIKKVRAAAEEELDLEDGWFKGEEDWNEKSKELIKNAVVRSFKVPIEVYDR